MARIARDNDYGALQKVVRLLCGSEDSTHTIFSLTGCKAPPKERPSAAAKPGETRAGMEVCQDSCKGN
ncbi:hypothetical protein FHX16_003714 [Rhizobium sp. BK661]|nr:hypothetical protein [Rhizobium sp. BK661]